MSVPVVNVSAPEVSFVTPSDGARVTAGRRTTVRVEAVRADAVRVLVDGAPTWTAPLALLERPWTPAPGTHRLVAVASRDGVPDAVAAIEVVAVEDAPAPAAPTPAAPAPPPDATTPATPVPAGGPEPGADPGTVEAAAPPGAGPAAPRRPRRAAPAPPVPAAPGAVPAAEPSGPRARGDDDGGGGPVAAIGRLLSDPERVAWTVAFPFLLVMAALAYALLQRFVDGGRKLAWRGRGTPDDTMIEF
ncbi:MAG: Ig-like domain-containing protein [Thermoleophilia bacterium]